MTLSRREFAALGLAAAASGCRYLPLPGDRIVLPAGSDAGTLNALAMAKGMRFGSCLGTGPSGAPQQPGVTAGRANQFDDPALRALFVEQCGVLVPENELKWYSIRKTPETFDFSRADRLADFATETGLAMRGHTLLWHHPQWFPAWVATYDFGSRPATEAERLLTEHIRRVCARYPQIFAWDVVNETIDHDTGEMRQTVFTKYLGDQVIDIAFRTAREAMPRCQLVYNDYMSWGARNEKHRAGVLRLLERLKKNGVPIDAMGVQSHIGPGATEVAAAFDAEDQRSWCAFLDEATGMGLDLVITEFDVGDQTMEADVTARDAEVAKLAHDYLGLMLSYRQLRYVMAWGLVDKYSWLRERWPRADGLLKRPLPYDDDYQPKPLRDAVADAFRAAPERAWLA